MRTEPFPSEAVLVDMLCDVLGSSSMPWGPLDLTREFGYMRGRTDVVAVSGRVVIAFEAKLTRWRDALHQAYRNRCFAHQSYVVLPEDKVRVAVENRLEFARRGIGLCGITDGEVVVHVPACHEDPVQPWLSEAALTLASGVDS